MLDQRAKVLADKLVNYCCGVQPGDQVLIECIGIDPAFCAELIERVYAAGGVPFTELKQPSVERALLAKASAEQLDAMADYESMRMTQMQAYIGCRGGNNPYEMSDILPDQNALYQRHFWSRVHGRIRVPDTRWVVLRYPQPSMAQMAAMSNEAFEELYFNVCNLDYARMSKAMQPLVALMERTDRVRLTGQETDLRFSISGIPAIPCDGHLNIPDGEIYTAPVRDSVEGFIRFNTPAIRGGVEYKDIRLAFEKGRIVEAASDDTDALNAVLDTDEGARYIGEFAIGVNPYITRPMKDTLFDEKITGSIHFTPGSCYDDASNGNRSAIHWDLVYIQTPAYGGGEMYFDDVLVRKDGLFVHPDLLCLNPENLI